jgi:hypothetical protein
MASVYALLCAATLAQSDCGVANAIDVVRLPDTANEQNCWQGAMATLASLAIQPDSGEYGKIVCAHAGHFCSEPVSGRRPYCEQHCAICYLRVDG